MSWKNSFYNIFKGRGKSWYKADLNSEVGEIINCFLAEKESQNIDTSEYRKYTKEEGFYWLCFLNVQGSPDDTTYMFEVRWNGSAISNRKEFVTLTQKQFNSITCLNATPRKLGLEGNKPKLIKNENYTKKTKKVVLNKKLEKNETLEDLENQVEENVIYYNDDFKSDILIKPCRPIVKIKLPGREDIPQFEEFLINEGAL